MCKSESSQKYENRARQTDCSKPHSKLIEPSLVKLLSYTKVTLLLCDLSFLKCHLMILPKCMFLFRECVLRNSRN